MVWNCIENSADISTITSKIYTALKDLWNYFQASLYGKDIIAAF